MAWSIHYLPAAVTVGRTRVLNLHLRGAVVVSWFGDFLFSIGMEGCLDEYIGIAGALSPVLEFD